MSVRSPGMCRQRLTSHWAQGGGHSTLLRVGQTHVASGLGLQVSSHSLTKRPPPPTWHLQSQPCQPTPHPADRVSFPKQPSDPVGPLHASC